MLSLGKFLIYISICLVHSRRAKDKQSQTKSQDQSYMSFYDWFAQTDRSRLDLVATHEGFRAENHKVSTEDGFTLTLTRILPRQTRSGSRGEPVLLLHGTGINAASWLFLPPKYNLAYLLASAGYDVWLFNSRGKFKSDGHVEFTSTNPHFWNWSFHEVGVYDVPASIDYALKTSQQPQMTVITFSMGSDYILIALAERPEYNKKVGRVIALSPGFPIRTQLGFLWGLVRMVAKSVQKAPAYRNCSVKGERRGCATLLARDTGMAPYNPTNRDVAASMYKFICLNRCTISAKTYLHTAQRLESDKNSKYAFNSTTNLRIYNSSAPPEYDMSKVTVPIYIFYGEADKIVIAKDVERFCKDREKAGQDISCIKIREPRFGHGDFMFNTEAKKYVWDKVMHILKYDRDTKPTLAYEYE